MCECTKEIKCGLITFLLNILNSNLICHLSSLVTFWDRRQHLVTVFSYLKKKNQSQSPSLKPANFKRVCFYFNLPALSVTHRRSPLQWGLAQSQLGSYTGSFLECSHTARWCNSQGLHTRWCLHYTATNKLSNRYQTTDTFLKCMSLLVYMLL